MLNLLSRNHAETLRSSVFALKHRFTNDASERKRVVSSAYMKNLITSEELTGSLIDKVNRTGPRRDPWGTSDIAGSRLAILSLAHIN